MTLLHQERGKILDFDLCSLEASSSIIVESTLPILFQHSRNSFIWLFLHFCSFTIKNKTTVCTNRTKYKVHTLLLRIFFKSLKCTIRYFSSTCLNHVVVGCCYHFSSKMKTNAWKQLETNKSQQKDPIHCSDLLTTLGVSNYIVAISNQK